MSYVFCNRCGHRNPPTSGFCSACGTVLDLVEDRTITIAKVDPLQDAPGVDDDVIVNLEDIPTGTGILVVRHGEEEGEHYVLDADQVTIGRHEDNVIALDDITVSRQHSRIHRRDNSFVVEDLGSLNGTYVNQRRVDVTSLQHGDELQIGKFRFVFLEGLGDRR